MTYLRFHVLLVALGLAALGTAAVAEEKEKEKVLFEDNFADKLSDGWSWVREDAKRWKLDKGALVLRTSTGGLWMKDNNNHNLLLRTPPEVKEGGYAVEVQVENEPTDAFEHAGLLLYWDDDTYAALLKEKVGKNQVVQLVTETDGKPKVGFAEKPQEGKTVWLRMTVVDGKIRGQYRLPEKEEWLTVGQCDLPGKGAAKVALTTGYAAKDAEHYSRFSRFRIVAVAK